MQGRTQRASNDRLACGAGEFRDDNDLNALSLETYFRGRNAPYSLNDPGNPMTVPILAGSYLVLHEAFRYCAAVLWIRKRAKKARNGLKWKIRKLTQATEMTEKSTISHDFVFSVAPMMDWLDFALRSRV